MALICAALAPCLGGCAESLNTRLLAIKKGDQEEVRETALILGDLLAEKEAAGYPFDEGDRQAVELLKTLALKSEDFVTRMRALSALKRLRKGEAAEVYLKALGDEHWGVRWEGAKALEANPAPGAATVLAERLQEESRLEVRLDLVRALARCDEPAAIRALLEVYLDLTGRHRDNRLKAYAAVKALSGRNYAFEDQASWREYYEKELGGEGKAPAAPPSPSPSAPGGAGP